MSAITFPNNPTPGTQTTVNGITYTFTDGTWVAVGQSNSTGAHQCRGFRTLTASKNYG